MKTKSRPNAQMAGGRIDSLRAPTAAPADARQYSDTGASAAAGSLPRRAPFGPEIVAATSDLTDTGLLARIAQRYPGMVVMALPSNDTNASPMSLGEKIYYVLNQPIDLGALPRLVNRTFTGNGDVTSPRHERAGGASALPGPTAAQVDERAEFLHSVAQEIRTPLTAVIACSEMLEDELFPADRQQTKKLADAIKKSAWLLNRNLQDLLESAAARQIAP